MKHQKFYNVLKNFNSDIFQIEELIRTIPGVADVAVFGIPNPNDQEHVAAAVVKKQGEVLRVSDIFQRVKASLESYKHLHGGIFVLDFLPKSPQGKLQRKFLVDMLM